MNNNEIKQANRKALPKFIFMMIIALLGGGVLGFCIASYDLNSLSGLMKRAAEYFGLNIAPWLMIAVAVVVLMICIPLYRSSKMLLSKWDGEEEELSDAIEEKLSAIMWVTGMGFILSFFLIAASYSTGFEAFEHKNSTLLLFVSIGGFFAIMIEAIIFQQKCVDMVRKMNPEKDGSVYDLKFQKKWMDSCDEAEKIMVGKCSFKAYNATNITCAILAIVLAICALTFGIGFLPSLVVCLIWAVNQCAYCREAFKYSKAGNKIS